MTPEAVLSRVLKAGGQVIPDLDHPALFVPPHLEPLVIEHRSALRPLVRYQAAVQRWEELTAQGQAADSAEKARVYQLLIRLLDEAGLSYAKKLQRERTRTLPFFTDASGPLGDP